LGEPGLGEVAGAEEACRTAIVLFGAKHCGGMRHTIAGRDVSALRRSCSNGLAAVLKDALTGVGAEKARAVEASDRMHVVRGQNSDAMVVIRVYCCGIAWIVQRTTTHCRGQQASATATCQGMHGRRRWSLHVGTLGHFNFARSRCFALTQFGAAVCVTGTVRSSKFPRKVHGTQFAGFYKVRNAI